MADCMQLKAESELNFGFPHIPTAIEYHVCQNAINYLTQIEHKMQSHFWHRINLSIGGK